MGKAKHTPWQTYNGGQDGTMIATLRNGARTVVAELVGDSDVMRANARIIAAAPDLLVAIEALKTKVLASGSASQFFPELEQAIRAIAKATDGAE